MKLKPAIPFGENMILQRGKPIAVWGRCAGGDTVSVTLGDNTVKCVSDRGKWSVHLPAMEACDRITMYIVSENTGESLRFENVAIGEVWIAGGQSNMEFLFKYDVNAKEMIEKADDQLFRFFDMPEVTYPGHYDEGFFENYGFWRSWRPTDAEWFSGVGVYFALKLREALNVPIGILGCNYGGTVASSWTDMETLSSNPDLRPVLSLYEKSLSSLDFDEYQRAVDKQTYTDPLLMQPMLDKIMMGEKPEMKFPDPKPGDTKPFFAYLGPKSPNAPSVLYNNMLKAVAPYTAKGVIWYQGESDEDHGWADFYDKSISAMISSWRKAWQEELPFLQVMLAPFDHWGMAKAKKYPVVRQMQLKVCDELPQVYCACIMDAGEPDNIHPRRKQPVGERLALIAERYVYGFTDIEADSPRAKKAVLAGDTVTVLFSHTAGNLSVNGDVKFVRAFINDSEVPVSAKTENDRLIITSEAFLNVDSVRIEYANENYCKTNLYGGTGLPVYPFIITASR